MHIKQKHTNYPATILPKPLDYMYMCKKNVYFLPQQKNLEKILSPLGGQQLTLRKGRDLAGDLSTHTAHRHLGVLDEGNSGWRVSCAFFPNKKGVITLPKCAMGLECLPAFGLHLIVNVS